MDDEDNCDWLFEFELDETKVADEEVCNVFELDERTVEDDNEFELTDAGLVETEVEKVEGGDEDAEVCMYGPQAYCPCILGALIGQRKFSEQT